MRITAPFRFSFFVLALFGAGAAAGCGAPGEPGRTGEAGPRTLSPDRTPAAGPALWIAADEDTTVYLFGTVHVLKPGTDWRTAAFDTALENADAVYLEVDTESAQAQAAFARVVTEEGLFTDGRTLSAVLDAADEADVAEAAEAVGSALTAFEAFRPWLAALQLTNIQLQQLGYRPDSGVEAVVAGAAARAGTPLRFLETPAEQISFFAELDEADQVDFLVSTAEQITDEPELLDGLIDAWAAGDVAALSDLVSDEAAFGSAAVYDTLLADRNIAWAAEIERLMAEEPGAFLVAVGAAHLAGEDALPGLLRARGVEVSGP